MKNYLPISDLQVKTIKLLNKLIDDGKSQQQIWSVLAKKGYRFRGVPTSNGRLSRSRYDLVREQGGKLEYSFVTLIQDRRSSKTTWETIGLF